MLPILGIFSIELLCRKEGVTTHSGPMEFTTGEEIEII